MSNSFQYSAQHIAVIAVPYNEIFEVEESCNPLKRTPNQSGSYNPDIL